MNRFLLSEDITQGSSSRLDPAGGLATRYGSVAMESLVNDLLKLGARLERLEVKLAGGGRLLASMTDMGECDIRFARVAQPGGAGDCRRGWGGFVSAPGSVFPAEWPRAHASPAKSGSRRDGQL